MHHVADFPIFTSTLEDSNDQIVYLFGTGISAALTGKPYSWWKWISDGISLLMSSSDPSVAATGRSLDVRLKSSSSTENMVAVAGDVITATKSEGLYDAWMHESFEVNHVTNTELQNVLIELTHLNDLFITTNYDYLLEEATGLKRLTYEDADKAYAMLEAGKSDAVIHIHGAYDSSTSLDNIIASQPQYEAVLANKGAQFIQNILGTCTIIFIGCGKTSEDANIAQFIVFAHKYLKLDKPYFFLCREGEEPDGSAGLPANTRIIPYGKDYSDLTPFLKEVADIRHSGYFLNAPFVGRNAYRQEPVNNMGLAEYHFMQERIPFCGREEELSELQKFLDDDRQNLWWAISGQAGSGKSRLALELLKRLKRLKGSSWFGFFLNKNATEADCEKLIPFKNTVVIIDYIVGNESHISRAVESLYRIFSKTVYTAYSSYKLRILFIERENSDGLESWIEKVEKSLKDINVNAVANFSNREYSPVDSTGSAGGSGRSRGSSGSTGSSGLTGSGRSGGAGTDRKFLELFDMDDASVEKMIGLICKQHGLPEDHLRDRQLREEYHDKFEMLHYRPLFVEMFVEAWIDNDCVSPRYDTFRDLLKIILKREQDRWLVLCKNDYEVCNAWISIVALASCIGAVKVSELEGGEGEGSKYKEDWNKIQKFIKSNTFAGEQREKSFQYLVDSMCQNVMVQTDKVTGFSDTTGTSVAAGSTGSNEAAEAVPTPDSTHTAGSKDPGDRIIHPLYPDILKEFMLLYYLDDEERINLANFLWDKYPRRFQIFVMQCISDFPYDEDVFDLVNKCRQRVSSPEVLLTRSQFLKQSVINFRSGDTPEKILDFIKHEDEFWHDFDPLKAAEQYKINTGEQESKLALFGILKFNGLLLVAEQYGGWSDVPRLMTVAKEALDVECGLAGSIAQISRGMDLVRNLEEHGFHKESKEISDKVNILLKREKDSNVDIGLAGQIRLIQMNNEFMQFMLDGELYAGYQYLKKMLKECGNDLHSLETFSQSCRSLAMISLIMQRSDFIDRAEYLLKPLYEQYPNNSDIAANYVAVEVQKLQTRFFDEKTGDFDKVKSGDESTRNAYQEEIEGLGSILDYLDDSDSVEMAWAMVQTFRVNLIMDDKSALSELIDKADTYLDEHPYADGVPQVYIAVVRAMHPDEKDDPVTKEEIDKAYSYMLRFPESENLRREFFKLLEKSTEAGHKDRYLPKQIRSAINNDRMYNPMYLQGLDDVDMPYGYAGYDDYAGYKGYDDEYGNDGDDFDLDDLADNMTPEMTMSLLNAIREGKLDDLYDVSSDSSNGYASDEEYDGWKPQEPFKRDKKKIMPNDPCPCGSGKKFKKCCKGKGIYD